MEFLFWIALTACAAYALGRKHGDAEYRADIKELDRWRLNWTQARQWLAEFDDAVDALECVKTNADGFSVCPEYKVRDKMRARRDGKVQS